jgi:zinc transporter 9
MYSAGKKGHSHAMDTQAKLVSSAGQQNGLKPPSGFQGIERSGAQNAPFSKKRFAKAHVTDIVVERTPEAHAPLMRKPEEKSRQKEKGKEQEKGKETEPEPETEENHPLAQKGGDDDSTEGHKEGHTRVHAPEGEEEKEESHNTEEKDHHAYIGVALILGFIVMFVVDHLPEALAPSKPQYQPLHISLSDLSRGPHNSSSLSLNTMTAPVSPMPERMIQTPPPKSSATTIGLVIHAFADGIALGASSTAPSTSLSLIIFFAIMLHKAPAAFGLTSVLLKQGLSKRTARTHLIMFSLAAPAGAVFTWGVVHALGRSTLGGDDGLTWTTGWVLLFSGGTFLYVFPAPRALIHTNRLRYVAMHAMTEATSSHDDPMANGYIESYRSRNTLSKSDIATAMAGMLIPLVTQVGHVH